MPRKFIAAIIMALSVILSLAPVVRAEEPQASGDITVYIDFEGYNLGQGYYIEPAKLN